MLHRLRREVPGKDFIPGPTDHCACADCRYMKMNTMEKMAKALDTLEPAIEMDPALLERARIPIERMLDWSRN